MSRYIAHVTLTTGHTRRSWRHELAPGITAVLRPVIEQALTGEHAPIPGAVQPRCTLTGGAHGRCIALTVWGPPLDPVAFPWALETVGERVPIVVIGIAPHSRCGALLWRNLHDTVVAGEPPLVTDRERCPEEPWCATRLSVGAAIYPEAMEWVGDLERCLAWAWGWSDRREARQSDTTGDA